MSMGYRVLGVQVPAPSLQISAWIGSDLNFLRWFRSWWGQETEGAAETLPPVVTPPLENPEVVEFPIGWELDLHTFRPSEARSVVDSYLGEAASSGFLEVRIIHGKGRGHMRRNIHGLLAKHPRVLSFTLAPPEMGGWGATLVRLKCDNSDTPSTTPTAGGEG